MKWFVGFLFAILLFILAKNLWKFIPGFVKKSLMPLFVLMGCRSLQSAGGGGYKLSGKNLKRHLFYSVLAGALMINIPGLYVGRIVPLYDVTKIGFWLPTVLLFLLLSVISYGFFKIGMKAIDFRFSEAIGPLTLSGLLTLFALASGFVIAGYGWWFAGKICLAQAKKDVLAAGYSLDMPPNAPKVPDNQNAVFFLNQAWKTKTSGNLFEPYPRQDQPFFQKKSEYEFLLRFLDDAKTNTLTAEEIKAAHRLLDLHSERFRLVDKAREMKNVDWGMDYTVQPPFKVELPRYAPFLNLCRLFACKAVLDSKERHPKEALEDIQAGLFLARVVGESRGYMICEMIKEAMDQIILGVAPLALQASSPESFKGIIFPELDSQNTERDFKKALELEYFGYSVWREKASWWDYAVVAAPLYQNAFFNDSDFGIGEGHLPVLGFLFAVFYRPFVLFDTASGYENKILKLAALDQPFSKREESYKRAEEEYKSKGWFDGLQPGPLFFHMHLRALVSAAYNRLIHAAVEAKAFHKKGSAGPNPSWNWKRARILLIPTLVETF